MVTIRAAQPCEALLKTPAFRTFPNYMGNYRAEEAILPREEIIIAILEFIKMMIE